MGEHSSPVVEGRSGLVQAARQTVVGAAVAMLVYLVTNPYLLINALVNREVLASNFGNSFAMYEVSRIGEGFVRVVELTTEGATLPLLVLGVLALIISLARKRRKSGTVKRGLAMGAEQHARATLGHGTQAAHGTHGILVLAVPAAVFFLQFVMIGAGKPAEYGRFGVFTNTALAIGTACLLVRRWTRLREIVNWVPALLVVLWVGQHGGRYLLNFQIDSTATSYKTGSRVELATEIDVWFVTHPALRDKFVALALPMEPAPYCCPPLRFASIDVYLARSEETALPGSAGHYTVFIRPIDSLAHKEPRSAATATGLSPTGYYFYTPRTVWVDRWLPRIAPISWANKRLESAVFNWPAEEATEGAP